MQGFAALSFIALHRLAQSADAFDIIHFHTDYLHFPLFAQQWSKTLTTLHGRLDLPDLPPVLREFAMMPLVSISNAQRLPAPWANWYGTVHHGLPPSLYPGGCGDGGYLAFIGRICPEKRPDWAIEIARRTGLPLAIAAKVDKADRTYYKTKIKPLLKDPRIDFWARSAMAKREHSWAMRQRCCFRSIGRSCLALRLSKRWPTGRQ